MEDVKTEESERFNEQVHMSSPYLVENFTGLDLEVHSLFGSKATYFLSNGQRTKISIAEKNINQELILYDETDIDYTDM